MKTVFDKGVREELIKRVNALSENSQAQWGKMNVYQMLRHCVLWEGMVHQNKKYKRVFIGRLLGSFLLKNELKNENPMRKNNPTIPELKATEGERDFTAGKKQWITFIESYANYSFPDYSFIHPFFGKMSREQIGFHAYKHTDHHLRQFNC